MEATGSRIIEYGKENAEFSIYDIADIHIDDIGFSEDYLLRDVQRIKKDIYSTWFLGGDYANFILPGDKRFNPEIYPPNFKVRDLANLAAHVSGLVIDALSPIKDKCLGAGYGNHDYNFLSKNGQMGIHTAICSSLNVPNMRYAGWADLYFVHNPETEGVRIDVSNTPPPEFTARLRCVVHHGFSTAATAGGKLNALKRLVDSLEADLVMMGHVHEQFAKSFTRLTVNENCTQIKSKVTMGMITGTYLRGYVSDVTSYGEMRGYFPTSLGATRAIYKPSEKRLVVENVADGIGG
jgi:hypothetical protein